MRSRDLPGAAVDVRTAAGVTRNVARNRRPLSVASDSLAPWEFSVSGPGDPARRRIGRRRVSSRPVTPNPYAPPQTPGGTPVGHPTPAGKGPRLFGSVAVAVHFLIIPIVGAGFAVRNYLSLGDKAGTARSLLLFFVPAIGLMAFGVAVQNRGQLALVWLAKLGIAALIFRDQQPVVQKHLEAGGRKARWVLAWLLLLPLLVVTLALWQVLNPARNIGPG